MEFLTFLTGTASKIAKTVQLLLDTNYVAVTSVLHVFNQSALFIEWLFLCLAHFIIQFFDCVYEFVLETCYSLSLFASILIHIANASFNNLFIIYNRFSAFFFFIMNTTTNIGNNISEFIIMQWNQILSFGVVVMNSFILIAVAIFAGFMMILHGIAWMCQSFTWVFIGLLNHFKDTFNNIAKNIEKAIFLCLENVKALFIGLLCVPLDVYFGMVLIAGIIILFQRAIQYMRINNSFQDSETFHSLQAFRLRIMSELSLIVNRSLRLLFHLKHHLQTIILIGIWRLRIWTIRIGGIFLKNVFVIKNGIIQIILFAKKLGHITVRKINLMCATLYNFIHSVPFHELFRCILEILCCAPRIFFHTAHSIGSSIYTTLIRLVLKLCYTISFIKRELQLIAQIFLNTMRRPFLIQDDLDDVDNDSDSEDESSSNSSVDVEQEHFLNIPLIRPPIEPRAEVPYSLRPRIRSSGTYSLRSQHFSEFSDSDDSGDPSQPQKRTAFISTLKRQLAQERDQRLCIVCQVELKTIILMPCRHLSMCNNCTQEIIRADCLCPICRRFIQNAMHVYV